MHLLKLSPSTQLQKGDTGWQSLCLYTRLEMQAQCLHWRPLLTNSTQKESCVILSQTPTQIHLPSRPRLAECALPTFLQPTYLEQCHWAAASFWDGHWCHMPQEHCSVDSWAQAVTGQHWYLNPCTLLVARWDSQARSSPKWTLCHSSQHAGDHSVLITAL